MSGRSRAAPWKAQARPTRSRALSPRASRRSVGDQLPTVVAGQQVRVDRAPAWIPYAGILTVLVVNPGLASTVSIILITA